MKRLLILTVLVLGFGYLKAQTIKIGQSAEQIKTLIEWTTKDHNKPDSYGNRSNSYWTWDVKYYDGQITEVIQCYQDQYLLDFRVVANYCKHYMMEKGKLAYILSQFENISVDKLRDSYSTNYGENKIGELYFSDDYEHYSKIYLANNGIATVEWRKTVISELPSGIQQTVKSKLTTTRQETETKKEKEFKEAQSQDELDKKEREFTILVCDDFYDGLALVGIDSEHKAGEMNYGYGKKLFGYINNQGKYVTEPKYEQASSFQDGFALVTTNSRYTNNWEFINTKGENAFNQKFADARSFSEGFAAVRLPNQGYGFIDKSGKPICKPQYEEVGDFKEGFARVKFQGKWGYIDKTGKEVIYPQFTSAYDFSEGVAAVSKFVNYHYTEYGFINNQGEYSFPAGKIKNVTYIIKGDFVNGFALIEGDVNHSLAYGLDYGGLGYISNDGKAKVKGGFRELYNYSDNGLARAQKSVGHKYGFINAKQQWAINPIFDDAGDFIEGLARVKINSNWGFINQSGDVVINKNILNSKTEIQTSAPFDAVSDFSDGLAIVQTRQKLGYIDKSGNWVIQPELLGAKPFVNGIARVKLPDRKGWNYIDKSGKILFENFQ